MKDVISKADREALQSKYGKGNYKIKLGHGGATTLYVKKNGHFVFESYEHNRVLNPKNVVKVEDHSATGYKVYTLDVKCKELDQNAQLISSKTGKELDDDIRALRNAILAK